MSRIDLEPQRQIIILKCAKELLLDAPNSGLCYIIKTAIKAKELQIYIPTCAEPARNIIEECIPLFTKENATKYAGARVDFAIFWWPVGDMESRQKFLDWMITELQKQIKHED